MSAVLEESVRHFPDRVQLQCIAWAPIFLPIIFGINNVFNLK